MAKKKQSKSELKALLTAFVLEKAKDALGVTTTSCAVAHQVSNARARDCLKELISEGLVDSAGKGSYRPALCVACHLQSRLKVRNDKALCEHCYSYAELEEEVCMDCEGNVVDFFAHRTKHCAERVQTVIDDLCPETLHGQAANLGYAIRDSYYVSLSRGLSTRADLVRKQERLRRDLLSARYFPQGTTPMCSAATVHEAEGARDLLTDVTSLLNDFVKREGSREKLALLDAALGKPARVYPDALLGEPPSCPA